MDNNDRLTSEHTVSLLSDSYAEHDLLDYSAYRDALISVIEGFPPKKPLTVGIFGSWGSGKTTLLRMIQKELKKHNTLTIWVNVWRFADEEDVWKAFLQAILLKVREETPWIKRISFSLGLLKHRIEWKTLGKKVPEMLVRVAIVVIPLYLSLSNLLPIDKSGQPLSVKVGAGVGTILSTVLGWYVLVQPYVQAVRERVKVDLADLVKSSPLKERVSLLERFKEYFEDMVRSLAGEKGRMIVFVDDLDRCPPDRIVSVLDAIKLFLDTPNCVYIIGLDREIVEQAITTKFAKYEEAAAEAREYLEKIIALPFDLPPLSGQQMKTLVSGLDTRLPGEERAVQVFALGQEPNPRKVKRTINMFLLLWALAQRRSELGGFIKPIRLAKMVVIHHSYRSLYLLTTVYPTCIGDLEVHFRTTGQVEASEITTSEASNGDQDTSHLPDYLKSFANDENLKRLLTLHSGQGKESEEANFAIWQDGTYVPLPEEEIRAYIALTRTVTPERVRVFRPSFEPMRFIDREREVAAFARLLGGDSSKQIILVEGSGGYGKTALLGQYRRMCEERNIPVAFLDMSTSPDDIVGFIDTLCTGLRPNWFLAFRHAVSSEASVSQISSAFLDDLESLARTDWPVIMFDTYEQTSEAIKDWIENNLLEQIANGRLTNVVVVIAGRLVPDVSSHPHWESSALQFASRPFSFEATEDYIRLSGLKVSDENLRALYDASGGRPSLIAELVSDLVAREAVL